MPTLLRVRATSFLAGFALASGLALLQLRRDLTDSHQSLAAQAQGIEAGVVQRLEQLEAAAQR